MFQVNTLLKISFGDWLYILGYDLNMGTQLSTQKQRAYFFENAKGVRFRFEHKEWHSEMTKIDLSFQYGNYHLSKINFEDFKPISIGDVQRTIEMQIHEEYTGKVAEEKIKSADLAIGYNLNWLLQDIDEVYKLDLGNPNLEDKIAPFATHSLFSSFLAFSNKEGKVVYLELGSD
jgi:hypothetical protein